MKLLIVLYTSRKRCLWR